MRLPISLFWAQNAMHHACIPKNIRSIAAYATHLAKAVQSTLSIARPSKDHLAFSLQLQWRASRQPLPLDLLSCCILILEAVHASLAIDAASAHPAIAETDT